MNEDEQRSIDRMINNNEMVPEKIEPVDLTNEYVLSQVMEYVHEQGQDSMDRLLESGKDSQHWPIRLQLDVLLKMLLNEVGSLQHRVLILEEKLNEK